MVICDCIPKMPPIAAVVLTLRPPPLVTLLDHCARLPLSKPSAKIRSGSGVLVAVGIGVKVAVGNGVLVAVGSGVNVAVG